MKNDTFGLKSHKRKRENKKLCKERYFCILFLMFKFTVTKRIHKCLLKMCDKIFRLCERKLLIFKDLSFFVNDASRKFLFPQWILIVHVLTPHPENFTIFGSTISCFEQSISCFNEKVSMI